MNSSILNNVGIDPVYLLAALFLIQIILFALLISANLKYSRLKKSYFSFMRGKDGKTLEDSILSRFEELENISKTVEKNKESLQLVEEKIQKNYQKVGIVKYDAFHEMGGNLSFALTMLDENNSGWIMNSMHSREGCYMYIKEIVKGQSYIELAEEEVESLEKAMYQES